MAGWLATNIDNGGHLYGHQKVVSQLLNYANYLIQRAIS